CLSSVYCFLSRYRDHRDLHSFPTRRSSDLIHGGKTTYKRLLLAGRQSNLRTEVAAEDIHFQVFIDLRFISVDVISEKDIGKSFRSEEHTSELQSRENLVCRLLLEKKKTNIK